MATKLKEVDVVVVGLGWTGGILSKELTEAGLKVVALERGGMRNTANDYSLPGVRDGFPGIIAVHYQNVEKFRDKKYTADVISIADMC